MPEIVYNELFIVRGLTDPDATVTINGKLVSLNDNGTFNHEIKLSKGENRLIIIAKSRFGVETKKEFIITLKDPVVIILQIGNATISINTISSQLDAPPFIDVASGRTLVPIRAIVEAIDGKIGWEASEQKVSIQKDALTMELWIGKPTALVNGNEVKIDAEKEVSPVIVNARTFLPLRFVAENLGFKVDWEASSQKITLSYPDHSNDD
jgi:hypothetical protein